ncbi:integrase, partial [Klebsiella pneumoniae]|nr:integrase [Klebsiella pneumoniae]
REKRDTARKQVANSIDPVEKRKAQKLAQQLSTENSFEAICREWHTNKADCWTVAYREEIIKIFEQDVFPFIGKRPIGEIKPL